MTINGKRTFAKEFAYDGCHKIYLLEREDNKDECLASGYDILPISKLKESFENSCGLQFIMSWDLGQSYVDQFEDADIRS